MSVIKLLVIEDDLIDQKSIKRALNKSFLDVEAKFVSSLEETNELQDDDWDLILTDYNLPSFNGVEILRQLKGVRKMKTPIIIMTGLASEQVSKEAIDAGAFDFITKNLITPEGIGLAVRNAIRITKQQEKAKELLNTLKKREKQLTETQKIAGLGSWEFSVNTSEVFWTDESYSIFGKDKTKGFSYEEYINSCVEEDRLLLSQVIDNSIRQNIPYEIVSRHVHGVTGEIVFVTSRGEPFLENGELVKLYGTVMDITSQKKIEHELIQAKLNAENSARLKQDFLANMSHEIRTPMNAILGFTDIVLENDLMPKVHENVQRIRQAGNNLLVIINDVLDFSKIEAGQLEVESVKFDLFDCIEQVKGQLESMASNKNLRLIFSIDEETPQLVKGDSVRLNQILINLINNAIKFTEKGFVEIRVSLLKEVGESVFLQFEIEDTGIGIPKSKQGKMFESFTQANSNTSRKYGGTGLGLAISKSLVEIQNGEIWFESEEGVGTKFFFTIEFGICEQALESNETAVLEKEIKLEGVKLLLVEDNLMNRELAIHFFKQWKIDYDLAENGEEGVDKVFENNYQIVLMDLSMPVMDGYQATRLIRSNKGEQCNVPIIAMTANAFSDDINKCFEIGMNDHISKPFKAMELKEKIYSLVKHGKPDKIDAVYRQINALRKQAVEEKTEIVSIESLEEMGGGSKEFIKEMLKIYHSETPMTLSSLSSSFKADDVNGVKAAAHKFRSPAGLLRISEAVILAEFVEVNVVEKGCSDEIKTAIEKLQEIGELSLTEVEVVLAGL